MTVEPALSFTSILAATAQRRPRDSALIVDGHGVSWQRLFDCTIAVAASLRDSRATRVGLLIKEPLLFICCFLGVMRAGKTVVPLPADINSADLETIADHCGLELLVTDQEAIACNHFGIVAAAELLECGFDQSSSFAEAKPVHDGAFVISYTSGSTSAPKGIVHTQQALLASAQMQKAEYCLHERSNSLITAPICTGRATMPILSTLFAGGTSVVISKYETEAVLHALKTLQISSLGLLPYQFRLLVDHREFDLERARACDFVLCGGTTLDSTLREELFRLFRSNFVEIYGSTECNLISKCPRGVPEAKRGSVGLPPDGVVVSTLDQENKPASGGEVVVFSPANMHRYVKREQEDACWYVDDQARRFVRTGDLGHIDEDGYLWLMGRKKDVLKVGGFSVFPSDIEAVLARHELVEGAAVIAKPHAVLGEVPLGFVVLRQRPAREKEQTLAICAWANSRLAPRQMLHGVIAIDSMPRNRGGKIDKQALRACITRTSG